MKALAINNRMITAVNDKKRFIEFVLRGKHNKINGNTAEFNF